MEIDDVVLSLRFLSFGRDRRPRKSFNWQWVVLFTAAIGILGFVMVVGSAWGSHDPNAPPQFGHGIRIGNRALIELSKRQQDEGVSHVALGLKPLRLGEPGFARIERKKLAYGVAYEE